MPTRRQFVANCAKLAVTVSVLPASALSASFGGREVSLEQISFADFASSVNSRFSVLTNSQKATELQLVRVQMHTVRKARIAGGDDAAHEKFSLLFTGSGSAVLKGAIYKFEHAGIGRFEMFISPVGAAGPECCHYEAVFNRPGRADA